MFKELRNKILFKFYKTRYKKVYNDLVGFIAVCHTSYESLSHEEKETLMMQAMFNEVKEYKKRR